MPADIGLLAGIGSNGKHKGNMQRDLLRAARSALRCDTPLPEVGTVPVPVKGPGQKARIMQLPMLRIYEWIAAMSKDPIHYRKSLVDDTDDLLAFWENERRRSKPHPAVTYNH